MEAQLFTKDEEIIREYSILSKKFIDSMLIMPAMDDLLNQISKEIHYLWKPIINGLQFMLLGDGFEMSPTYNHIEYYLKAYDVFSNVLLKIENKESLIYFYVNKLQISSLSLSRKINTNEVIVLFDNLINKFRNNKNEHIQFQIASAMLEKSFVIWQTNKNNITNDVLITVKNIEDEIINTFSSSDIPDIQDIVASCLNNKADTISKEIEINERKRIEIYTNIINRTRNSENEKLKIQLSRALLCKASLLEESDILEFIKNKNINIEKENNKSEILDLYTELINKFKHSNIPVIQIDYLSAMIRLAEIMKKDGQMSEVLRIYNSLIKNFKDSNNDIFLFYIAEALFKKASLLESQAKLKQDINIMEEAIKTYDELMVSKFTNYDSFEIYNYYVHYYVTAAMINKTNYLIENNKLDDALILIDKSIDRHSKHPYKDLHFKSLFLKIKILLMQAENNKDNEKYKQAIDISLEAINLYNNKDIDQQEKIAFIMLNMAIAKDNIGCYSDAINILKEVISIYGSKEFQIYEKLQKIVNEATQLKKNIEYFLPIINLFNFCPSNKKTIKELIESISKGNVIPVIGAGLSAFAGFPLWKEFLLNIFNDNKNLIQNITKDEFFKKSLKLQASCLEDHITKGIFENEIKRHFSDKDVDVDIIKKQPVWLLPKLFAQQIILTTNFDNLIKLVFGMQQFTTFEQCTRTDIDKINKKTNISTLLYKINGSVDSFKDVVLTENDFLNAYKKNGNSYKGMQKTFQNNKDVLFLGCSLEEKHEILDFIKEKNITIFTIYPCENDDAKKAETIKKLGKNGITSIVLYPPDDNHSYLFLLLQYICDCLYKLPI